MKILDTVIIGMGRMGQMRHGYLEKHGGFHITGVCDVNPENTHGFSGTAFTDWKTCIDTAPCEVVFVCTVNAVIPEIVNYALSQGKHVFSEKPPGRSVADAKSMKETWEKQKNLVLKYGFNHRYHNSILEAQALIRSGIVGEPVCARGVYGKAGNPNFAQEWRNDLAISGGGILLDQGIHMLDLLRLFLGDFSEVQSSVNQLVWNHLPTEDSAFAILKTNDGKVASLHSSVLQWRHKFDLDIMCTNGYIALNGLITSTQSYGVEKITYYKRNLADSTGIVGKPMEHTLSFNEDFSWIHEHEEFYQAVSCGKEISHGTAEDAIKVMALVEKIYESQ